MNEVDDLIAKVYVLKPDVQELQSNPSRVEGSLNALTRDSWRLQTSDQQLESKMVVFKSLFDATYFFTLSGIGPASEQSAKIERISFNLN